jgi:probable phosphoglycerate mutase
MTRGLPGTRCRRRIYLMRHGDVSYFDADGQPLDPRHVPLTEAGREHALAAAELLRDVAFDRALCSALPRSGETARLVLGARLLALQPELRLNEIRGGRLRAVPAELRDQLIGRAYDCAAEPEALFIGGESWQAFGERVLAVWSELLAEDGWMNLLLVAHDAVNRLLLGHVTGAGLAGMRAFEQDPACINIIEVDVADGRAERAHLRSTNLVAYNLAASGNHHTVMEKVLAEFISA